MVIYVFLRFSIKQRSLEYCVVKITEQTLLKLVNKHNNYVIHKCDSSWPNMALIALPKPSIFAMLVLHQSIMADHNMAIMALNRYCFTTLPGGNPKKLVETSWNELFKKASLLPSYEKINKHCL